MCSQFDDLDYSNYPDMDPDMGSSVVKEMKSWAVDRVQRSEPSRNKLRDWLIWNVHRVYINDPTMTQLDLSQTKLPTDCLYIGPKLAKAIASNTELQTLILDKVEMRSIPGMAADIAKSLAENKTLRTLSLRENNLVPDDKQLIAEALGKNEGLFELNISEKENVFLPRLEDALEASLKGNKFLIKLGCFLKGDGCRDNITRYLMRNQTAKRKRDRAAANGGA